MLSQKPDISRYPQIILGQGYIEQAFLDLLSEEGHLHVERNRRPTRLAIDESCLTENDEHPITVTLERVNKIDDVKQKSGSLCNASGPFRENLTDRAEAEVCHQAEDDQIENFSQDEIIRTKYLLGCDGAHSWTRTQLGIPMDGDKTNNHFGVMDIVPLTDFRM